MVSIYTFGRVALLGVTYYKYYRYLEFFRTGCTVLFVTYRGTRRVYFWVFPRRIINKEESEDWLLL